MWRSDHVVKEHDFGRNYWVVWNGVIEERCDEMAGEDNPNSHRIMLNTEAERSRLSLIAPKMLLENF